MLYVVLKFRAEMLDHGAHGHGCRISQRANGTPHDIFSDVVKQIEVCDATVTIFDSVHYPRQPAGTFTARGALSTRLMHIKVAQTLQALDHATAVIENNDCPR